MSRKERGTQYLPIFAAIVLLAGCDTVGEPKMQIGGLYSVEDGSGGYRSAKLLAFDSTVVHLSLYSNRYSARPDTILSSTLRLDPIGGEAAGRAHFAMAPHIFRAWNPVLAGYDSVTADEMRSIENWERSEGRVVGERE